MCTTTARLSIEAEEFAKPLIQARRPPDTLQPLAFGSFRNRVQLLRENHGVDREFYLRALFMSVVSATTEPLRLVERISNGRAITRQRILESPIFIVGHWRSGTTLLHNLLSADPNLGYVTLFQTIAPELALVGTRTLKPLLAKFTPKMRWGDSSLPAVAQDGKRSTATGASVPTRYRFRPKPEHHIILSAVPRGSFERTVVVCSTIAAGPRRN